MAEAVSHGTYASRIVDELKKVLLTARSMPLH